MPRREDLNTILVIGSGPIVIGQACEFDYSGTQACRALRQENYRVVLLNSNPATIMTDPEVADVIYIEPITPASIKRIVRKEKAQGHKIDALLPTIGGQTSLNVSVQLAESGFLAEEGIELIGADLAAIKRAEDREAFDQAMKELGYQTAPAFYVRSWEEAQQLLPKLSFPVVVRASFTLGGAGGAFANNEAEYHSIVKRGLNLSQISEVVVERSLLGFKEFELEVMKDCNDNVVVICSIENLDPLGVHTGDSLTVAPQQTLSDGAYQTLRNKSIAIIRKIGVSTGGANIQFAVHPVTDAVYVIEMNPRVSRSSALASKATGFPIAKLAAKLAVGYSLDEIPNDITKKTPACFEPTIDYVVVKIPKFAFEKFPNASPYLGVQMKAVGEVMALGRTFQEAFQKAMRSLESGLLGFEGSLFSYAALKGLSPQQIQAKVNAVTKQEKQQLEEKVRRAHYLRWQYLKDLFFLNYSREEIYALSKISHWFLFQLEMLFKKEQAFWGRELSSLSAAELLELKQGGFSDAQLACGTASEEKEVRAYRKAEGISPAYKLVDTCAAEFVAQTPYYYSTYDQECELEKREHSKLKSGAAPKEKVIILGGGPNRIGQGIEFDYLCVHASLALRDLGFDTVMVNSNPETVSTDYDVSTLLFFEPLTYEDTLNLVEKLHSLAPACGAVKGVVVHFGGQTPLNLSKRFKAEPALRILGTSIESIIASEDRQLFLAVLRRLNYLAPESDTALSVSEALTVAKRLEFPLLLRPSYVLGGRAMQVVYDAAELRKFFQLAQLASPGAPILIDQYLEDSIELDLDLISDTKAVVICGVLEHIERAGVHSGDSACLLPPQQISPATLEEVVRQAKTIALQLKVRGFMNLQFAIKKEAGGEKIYFLEVNPRGSRTVPFLSKATGQPWVKIAARVIVGGHLSEADLRLSFNLKMHYVALKESVFPFDKFLEEDPLLGPEMKSTGEVMAVGKNTSEAFFKAQAAVKMPLPKPGEGVLVTMPAEVRESLLPAFRTLARLNLTIYATAGTHTFLRATGLHSVLAHKIDEPGSPNIKALILAGQLQAVFHIPRARQGQRFEKALRLLAKERQVGLFTTVSGILIAASAMEEAAQRHFEVYALAKIHHAYSARQPL